MIAILVASLPTQAAELPPAPSRTPAKAPTAPVEVVNWTGLYIGGNFGYSWGRADSDFTLSVTGTTTTTTNNNRQSINGVLGGGQIGYNWQSSAFVYGLEADFQGADQKGRFIALDTNPTDVKNAGGAPGCTIGGTSTPCPNAITSTLGQQLVWFGTVRGRLGYLVAPRWLVYGTGGLAYGRVKSDFLSVEPDGETDVSRWTETRVGWAAGAGVEAMLLGRWTGRLEYLHVDLTRNGSTNSTFFHSGFFTPPPGIVLGTFAINTRATDEIVRVGLNYSFEP
jgi:outer membrane immunogenic protein